MALIERHPETALSIATRQRDPLDAGSRGRFERHQGGAVPAKDPVVVAEPDARAGRRRNRRDRRQRVLVGELNSNRRSAGRSPQALVGSNPERAVRVAIQGPDAGPGSLALPLTGGGREAEQAVGGAGPHAAIAGRFHGHHEADVFNRRQLPLGEPVQAAGRAGPDVAVSIFEHRLDRVAGQAGAQPGPFDHRIRGARCRGRATALRQASPPTGCPADRASADSRRPRAAAAATAAPRAA